LNIKANNLKFIFKGAKTPAFSGVNFTAISGKYYTLAGKNGSGKTTLLKILAGAYPEVLRGCLNGTIDSNGTHIDGNELINQTYYVPLPENAALISDCGINDILLSKSGDHSKDYVREVAKLLPPMSVLKRPLWSLSDGELQRILLVISLLSDRQLLLWDEPLLHLDADGIRILKNLIASIDLRGRIVIATSVDTDDNKLQFLDSFNLEETKKNKQANNEPLTNPGEMLLELDLRGGQYRQSDLHILNDMHIKIRERSVTHLKGDNGTGKSTLAMLIAGINPRFWQAKEYSRKLFDPSIGVAFLDSNPLRQLSESSILSEIEISSCGALKGDKLLSALPDPISWIKQRLIDDPRSLSFGEQKVLLAFAVFSSGAKIIIADELFAGLDLVYASLIQSFCLKHLQKGGAIVLAGHESSLEKLAPNYLVDLNLSLQPITAITSNNTKSIDTLISCRVVEALLSPIITLLGATVIIIGVISLPIVDNSILLALLILCYILLPETIFWRPPFYSFLILPIVVFIISFYGDPATNISSSFGLAIKATNWLLSPLVALKVLSAATLIQKKAARFRKYSIMFISMLNLSSALLRRVDRVISGTVAKTAKRYYAIKGRAKGLWSIMVTVLITILELAVEHRISLKHRLGTIADEVQVHYKIPLWIQWSLLIIMSGYITIRWIIL